MPEGVELGVEGGVATFVGTVATAGDDFVVVDEDAADGDLFRVESFFSLYSRRHEG